MEHHHLQRRHWRRAKGRHALGRSGRKGSSVLILMAISSLLNAESSHLQKAGNGKTCRRGLVLFRGVFDDADFRPFYSSQRRQHLKPAALIMVE